MEEGAVPSNWADLVEYSSELATNQDYPLAQTWLSQSNPPSDSNSADNPVVNLFAIVAVTDCHSSGNNNGKRSWSILTKKSVAIPNSNVAISMADFNRSIPLEFP